MTFLTVVHIFQVLHLVPDDQHFVVYLQQAGLPTCLDPASQIGGGFLLIPAVPSWFCLGMILERVGLYSLDPLETGHLLQKNWMFIHLHYPYYP